jgi:putative salt-induced outer membrane protein YdiY
MRVEAKRGEKMMSISKIPAILMMVLLFGISTAAADELHLKNGDRITGEVISMENNKLVFKTAYAGQITVEWQDVASLTTESPITVKLGDDISLHGTAEPARDGEIRVKQEKIAESATFDISKVTQINPKPKPTIKISGRANIGLSRTTGNTDTGAAHLDGKFTARTEKNRTTVSGEYDWEQSDGVNTVKKALGGIEYDQFFTQKWYGYGKVGLEYNKFRDLNLRTDVGVGPGYQVFESNELNLKFEGGLSYVNDDYMDRKDQNYAAYRLAADYDQYLFNKFLKLFFSNENLIRTNSTSDIISRTRTGVRIPFYKNLNVTGQYNLDWNNKPAPGTKKTDQSIIFSLGYSYDE